MNKLIAFLFLLTILNPWTFASGKSISNPFLNTYNKIKKTTMKNHTQEQDDLHLLTDSVVKAAINALNKRDRKGWLGAFAPGATFSDDGHKQDITKWSDKEWFSNDKLKLRNVRNVKNGGLDFEATIDLGNHDSFETIHHFTLEKGKIVRYETSQL